MGDPQLTLAEAGKVLQARKAEIARAVEERIYRELKSYSASQLLPAQESHDTVIDIVDFVTENLGSEDNRALDKSVLSSVIHFEEGIAARRVRYRISMVDLLHGVQILREEIWKVLKSSVGSKDVDFFMLERRVNALIDHIFVGISDAYLKSQEEIIAHHISALEKWEEVVKSASSIELKIPCRSEYVAIVRLQAEAIARRVGFTEEEIHDIVYAVGEAADNAIEHGFSDKGVDIHYLLTQDEMRVEITDFGGGFDPRGRGEECPDLFAERGRGIFMMKSLADDVQISSSNLGTHLLLVKKRNQPELAATGASADSHASL
ncbi:MAG: ATP-binding protein [Armatimonadetes bacterium]|nr:ATP-binding protein [Armatimonadota bacterium]